jgi:hypothetical protein
MNVRFPEKSSKAFYKMTDIYDMRVSGDTLSHLLFLTSEPGAVLLGRPQFFSGAAEHAHSLLP